VATPLQPSSGSSPEMLTVLQCTGWLTGKRTLSAPSSSGKKERGQLYIGQLSLPTNLSPLFTEKGSAHQHLVLSILRA
jgi:hypothetical protein